MSLLLDIDPKGNLIGLSRINTNTLKKELKRRRKEQRKLARKEKKPRKKKESNKVEILPSEESCKKCNQPMQRRKHRSITEKQLNKAFYYSEWDYCKPCGFLQHYDKYKVMNNNSEATYLKEKEILEEQASFLRSI